MLRQIVSVLVISPLALNLVASTPFPAQVQATEMMTTATLPACKTLPVLRRNDRVTRPNNHVKLLQKSLNKYGFRLNVDGLFRKATEDAVKDYQGRSEDPSFKSDGIVGPGTWALLGACRSQQ